MGLNLFRSPLYFVPYPFMYEISYGRVDVTYYRKSERYINSPSEKIDYRNIQNHDHGPVSKGFDE